MPPPSDETGEGQADPELAVLQAPFKETGVATPEKIKTYFYSFLWCNEFVPGLLLLLLSWDKGTAEQGIFFRLGRDSGKRNPELINEFV